MADDDAIQASTRGRKKRWHENVNLRLPDGAKARIDALLHEGEDRLDFIRGAIDKEVHLRESSYSKTNEATTLRSRMKD